jgi:hypothetical protein
LAPRTPQPRKTRLLGAAWKGGGGAAIANFYSGGWGGAPKPVDGTLQHPANPHGCKQNRLTGFLKSPRVGRFVPRVGRFSPRFCFGGFAPLSISLFNISEREKRERGQNRGGRASTGFKSGDEMYPRVGFAIHGFSGDEKRGISQCRQALSVGVHTFHGFERRNAPVPAVNPCAGGAHGV